MRYLKFIFTFFTGMLLVSTSYAQLSITEVIFPQYMQGAGQVVTSAEKRVPYVCRLTINGLTPNAVYRYYNRFVLDRTSTLPGDGGVTLVTQTGPFIRTTSPNFTTTGRYAEFTASASGSYTGWFAAEASTATTFGAGNELYFRVVLNDGNGGTNPQFVTSTSTIKVINFGAAATEGTGIRSTAATAGVAKNFVFLYDNTAGTGRPVSGTFIEADGVNNNATAFYASFYVSDVNEQDKKWGNIIPNNLAGGIQRIAQFSLADASQVGFKTSANGSWNKDGGGTISTVMTTGGITDVVVLDGSVINLAPPVQQSQAITFDPLTAKTYGEGDFDPGATASSTLTVTYSSNNPAVATIVNGRIHIVGAGTAEITADQAGNVDYLAAPSVVRTLTVNKANLTITANNAVMVQGDPVPANFTASYSGFVNGENESVLTTPVTFSTTATQTSPPNTYPITPGGATAANYNISFVDGTLTVNASRQAQTITFDALPVKTYGAPDFSTGATISSNLAINYTSSNPAVATVVNGIVQIKGVGTTTITASHPGDANYEPAADKSQDLIVNKAPLTITAKNKTKLVGQPNPELEIVYTGFVKGDTNTVLTTQPTISTTATTISPEGTYPITVTGATAVNYNITFVAGVLTITPLPPQTITFNTLAVKNYGDADVRPGATASSGLKVRYTSSNTNIATIVNDTMIHIVGAGTVNITASQPGDAFNAAAPDVTRVLTVQKVNLVIHVKDTSKLQGQPNPGFEFVYTGFVNGDNPDRLSTQPIASTTAATGSVTGKYPINISGATSNNYNIAQTPGVLSILPSQGSSQNDLSAYMSAPGQLRINVHAVEPGGVSVQLFDQSGTRLLQVNVVVVKGYNTFQLPVGNVTAGIYHVRLNGPDYTLRQKIVIR